MLQWFALKNSSLNFQSTKHGNVTQRKKDFNSCKQVQI